MRKLIVFFLLSSVVALAQNTKDLEKDWNDYNVLIKTGEIEQAMEFVNQGIFEVLPKQDMIDMMQSVFETPGMEIQFKDSDITKFDDSELVNNRTYQLFDYYQVMDMKLESVTLDDKEMQSMMLSQFQKQFGDDNVSYNDQTNFFTIKAIKRALGMYDSNIGDWRFLTLQDGQRSLLEQFLDEDVIKLIYP